MQLLHSVHAIADSKVSEPWKIECAIKFWSRELCKRMKSDVVDGGPNYVEDGLRVINDCLCVAENVYILPILPEAELHLLKKQPLFCFRMSYLLDTETHTKIK